MIEFEIRFHNNFLPSNKARKTCPIVCIPVHADNNQNDLEITKKWFWSGDKAR